MSNIKNIAEDIIQLTNKSNLLDDIVNMMNHIMKSTENTLKDDILKITDGAKLECEVDLEKIMGIVEEISSYKYSMEDELSSARGYIEEAEQTGWYSCPILLQLEDGSWLIPQQDDEGNDGGAIGISNGIVGERSEYHILPVLGVNHE